MQRRDILRRARRPITRKRILKTVVALTGLVLVGYLLGTITRAPAAPATLMVSSNASLTSSVPLEGESLSGTVYIWVDLAGVSVTKVSFYLNGVFNMTDSGSPYQLKPSGGTWNATWRAFVSNIACFAE